MRKCGRLVCGARMVHINSPVQLYCPNKPLKGQKRCWRHNRGHPYPPETMAAFARAESTRGKMRWQDPEYRARNIAGRRASALFRTTHQHLRGLPRDAKGRVLPGPKKKTRAQYDKDSAAALAKLEELMAENAVIVANQPAEWEKQTPSQQMVTLTGLSLNAMKEILTYKVTPRMALKDPAKMKLLQMRRDTAYGVITAQIRIGDSELRAKQIDQSQQFLDALDETRAKMRESMDSSTQS